MTLMTPRTRSGSVGEVEMGKRTRVDKQVRDERFPSPIATISLDAMEKIEAARSEPAPQALVDAFRRHTTARKTLTPRQIRELAAASYGWSAGHILWPTARKELAELSGLRPSEVERVLTRRDKTSPKSEGGPATEPVMIRLNAQQKKKAQRLAKKVGCKTVSAWVKVLVEKEIGQ